MTLVKIKREYISGKNIITQIEIKNHSDFEETGYDIVCAAISSSTELVINVISEDFMCECEAEITDEPPRILIRIPVSELFGEENVGNKENEIKSFAVSALLNGFAAHLKNIERSYPENIKVYDS